MAKRSQESDEDRARRKVQKAQLRLNIAQEKYAQAREKGKQEVEKARLEAAERLTKASERIERRANALSRAEANLNSVVGPSLAEPPVIEAEPDGVTSPEEASGVLAEREQEAVAVTVPVVVPGHIQAEGQPSSAEHNGNDNGESHS